MSNELVRYHDLPADNLWLSSLWHGEDAFDTMHRANPELARFAWLHKQEIADPAILRQLVDYRRLQMHERIALMGEITERMRVHAGLEERKMINDTTITLRKIDQETDFREMDKQIKMHKMDKQSRREELALERHSLDSSLALQEKNLRMQRDLARETRAFQLQLKKMEESHATIREMTKVLAAGVPYHDYMEVAANNGLKVTFRGSGRMR